MSSSALLDRLDTTISRDESVSWSQSRERSRPLVIGSSSHYAQEHKLTVDFYTESSERAAAYLSSLKAAAPHEMGYGLTSYHHLTQCTIPAPSIGDNWLDTEQSLQYSQRLLSFADGPCPWSVPISNPRVLASKNFRCELPVLSSGKNLDLLVLIHGIYTRQAPQLAKSSIPPLEVDESGGEGLGFPCWTDQLMKHFDIYLSKEAIQDGESSLPSEDACFYDIADTSGPTEGEISSLIDVEFTFCKKTQPQGTTFSSPLLPSKHTYEPFIPDSETRFIEPFSDTASLLGEDIKKVESHLAAEYDGGDIDPQPDFQTPPESSPVFPPPQWGNQRASSLRVDVSLSRSNRPIVKNDEACGSTAIKNALGSIKLLCKGADAQVTDFQDTSDQIPFLSTEIATRVRELGQQALRRVEQERLGGGPGPCRRVAVPIMDFTLQDPDWKKVAESAVVHFKSLRLSTPAKLAERIKRTTREEKKLRWRPLIGMTGRVSFSESLDANMQASAQFLDTGDCNAKGGGVDLGHLSERRTLLFLGDPVEAMDEIAVPTSNKQPHLTFPSPEPSSTNPKRTWQPPSREDPSPKKAKTESRRVGGDSPALLDNGDNDGIGGLLMSYLQIRAPEKALPTTSVHFPSESETASSKISSGFQGHVQPPWGNQIPSPQAQRLPAPSPEFDPTETASGYVVSTALGGSLIHHLDQLCSTAKLYARDFSSHAPLSSARPTMIRGGESALGLEADVPLSSSTGVVVTNLAQLRQRPLGGARQTKLRYKILGAATLYAKLIVLISVPNLKWTSDDTRAYAEFIAFVGALDPSIEAVLVGEGEECIVKWIVSLMNEHRYEGRRNEHLVVQQETSWEAFCRLGGMNVYAAQVLAGALKASYGDQGLSRLIGMTAEERFSAFEAIIGARRPLENISRWVGKTEV